MPTRVLRFRVTVTDMAVLRRTAEEVGVPLSTLVRDAVRLYVEDFTDCEESFRVNTPCPTPRYRQP